MKARKNFVVSSSAERLKYIFPLDFAKYLSYLEMPKNSKDVMLRSDFRKKGVCSKSVTKPLYWKNFLVSEYIFKLVYRCEGSRWSEICFISDITKKSLNRLLLLFILTLVRMVVAQKGPPTSFPPVTSTNLVLSPQNLLTFSFNPFFTLV